MIRWVLILIWIAVPSPAQQVVLGLSQEEIAITARFDGSRILIFGAIKRDMPPIEPPIEVIVTIAGPGSPVVVHRKARRFGIWVNTNNVPVYSAPSFYAVSTSGPLTDILTDTEDLRHKISIERAMRTVGASGGAPDTEKFIEALVRLRTQADLYQNLEGDVTIVEETLFRTEVALPADLTEGDYGTRIFLTRGGEVIDLHETKIDVRKVGLERWLYNTAQNQPALYGLMAIFLAAAAGWIASAGFRALGR